MDLSSALYSSSTITTAAACLGAVAMGVYIVWGPDFLFKKRGQCLGLINLGNTCFLNAVLQGLGALPTVKEWLIAAIKPHTGPLATALLDTLSALDEEREGIHSPSAILRALRHHQWSIDFQQQDAHELYHVILTTLAEEMVSCPSLLSELLGLLEAEREKSTSVAWTKTGRVHAPLRPPRCPLQGLLTSELLCCVCNYTCPMRYEMFDSLSLTLPTIQSQCSLQSCMADYVKSEVVQEVECPRCSEVSKKKTKRKFWKRLQLGRPPDCLCIHFKRTVWGGDGQLHKNNSFVSFPTSLDINQYLKFRARKSSDLYKLYAVVEHLGGPFSGHYQTYRRVKGRQWVCTSDTSVYRATTHDVTSCVAYMLFYSKSCT